MALSNTAAAAGFYWRYALFQLKERFSDVGNYFAYVFLYSFFIWLLTQMWGRFNAYQGNYTQSEVYVYIAIAELLFMTFLRSEFISRTTADFSVTLARPRSWLKLAFFGQMGSTLGGRCIYILTALVMLPILGVDIGFVLSAFTRLLILLPLLGVMESLLASIFASAQLLWHEARYLMLPVTKIFLALGGVFGPLADYGEPGRSIFLKLLPSDLFFQPAHFCVKGEFYQMTSAEWLARMTVWTLLFVVLNWAFFLFSCKRHQSFGG